MTRTRYYVLLPLLLAVLLWCGYEWYPLLHPQPMRIVGDAPVTQVAPLATGAMQTWKLLYVSGVSESKQAQHITSTEPEDGTMSITGWANEKDVLWMETRVVGFERVR